MASNLIANMVFYRTRQISRYRKMLEKNIKKMYVDPDAKRRDRACDDIKKNIEKIQEMIARNIDDVNNLELTILTFRETRTKDKYYMSYIW
jgi:hypothetical protein